MIYDDHDDRDQSEALTTRPPQVSAAPAPPAPAPDLVSQILDFTQRREAATAAQWSQVMARQSDAFAESARVQSEMAARAEAAAVRAARAEARAEAAEARAEDGGGSTGLAEILGPILSQVTGGRVQSGTGAALTADPFED